MLRLHGTAYDDPRYPELADRCRALIRDTAAQVLSSGVDVDLDWNHWSRARRAESRAWAVALGARAVVHHIVVPLAVAVARVEERARHHDPNAHVLDAVGVHHLAGLFEPPSADEGLEVRTVTG